MSQFLGFGDGSDSTLTISSDTTEAPIDSSCSGTAAATSLSATNASFAAGQIILIHQTRGTGADNWELNQISSYVAGTITLRIPLVNTYTDSGASQAQVRVLKQYSAVTINDTFTYTAKVWDGNVGGIIGFLCNGDFTYAGTLSATSCGFRGATIGGGASAAGQGEGNAGDKDTLSQSANGNGGGGEAALGSQNGGGGGGGNGVAGSPGTGNPTYRGAGGSTAGSTDLITASFGGGGGGGGYDGSGGNRYIGNLGGGWVIVFAKRFIQSGTGKIVANGETNTGSGGTNVSGGGGGGGGSIDLFGETIPLGTLCTATGSAGRDPAGPKNSGGTGGDGRIMINGCTVTGTTNPTANSIGGQSFCSISGGVF